jgi:hypothetical protein
MEVYEEYIKNYMLRKARQIAPAERHVIEEALWNFVEVVEVMEATSAESGVDAMVM